MTGVGPFKQGVGRLVASQPWPVIPVGIVGTHAVLPKGAWWPRRRPIAVVIGEPVRYDAAPDTQDGWRRIAADLERRVTALVASAGARGPAAAPGS